MSEETIEDAAVQLESDQVLLSFVFGTIDEPEEKIFILCFHLSLQPQISSIKVDEPETPRK